MTTRHPTVTDEGRRLLEGATPGPWRELIDGYEEPGRSILAGEADTIREGQVAWVFGDPWPFEANAALIVYAVNHLPAFLAAVEALRAIACEDPDCGNEYHDAARAALAPFTEEPTDG